MHTLTQQLYNKNMINILKKKLPELIKVKVASCASSLGIDPSNLLSSMKYKERETEGKS